MIDRMLVMKFGFSLKNTVCNLVIKNIFSKNPPKLILMCRGTVKASSGPDKLNSTVSSADLLASKYFSVRLVL